MIDNQLKRWNRQVNFKVVRLTAGTMELRKPKPAILESVDMVKGREAIKYTPADGWESASVWYSYRTPVSTIFGCVKPADAA